MNTQVQESGANILQIIIPQIWKLLVNNVEFGFYPASIFEFEAVIKLHHFTSLLRDKSFARTDYIA